MPSTDDDALASWGGGQDLSAWEALMWRTGGDHRTRSTGVMIELLDTEPDWDRLVAAHDRFTQRVPRLRERVVEADGRRRWLQRSPESAFSDTAPAPDDVPAAFRRAAAFHIAAMPLGDVERLIAALGTWSPGAIPPPRRRRC